MDIKNTTELLYCECADLDHRMVLYRKANIITIDSSGKIFGHNFVVRYEDVPRMIDILLEAFVPRYQNQCACNNKNCKCKNEAEFLGSGS